MIVQAIAVAPSLTAWSAGCVMHCTANSGDGCHRQPEPSMGWMVKSACQTLPTSVEPDGRVADGIPAEALGVIPIQTDELGVVAHLGLHRTVGLDVDGGAGDRSRLETAADPSQMPISTSKPPRATVSATQADARASSKAGFGWQRCVSLRDGPCDVANRDPGTGLVRKLASW